MSEYIVQVMDNPLPTERKVVGELVRCKDCKHRIPDNYDTVTMKSSDVRYCYYHHMFHFADYYCAGGKRRRAKEGNRCD